MSDTSISNEDSGSRLSKYLNYIFPKLLSVIVLYAAFSAIDFRNAAEYLEKDHNIAASITWGTYSNIAAIVSFLVALLLVGYYRGAYSIFWAKAMEASLDERQLALRNRLFLKAYRWMALIIFIGLMSNLQSVNPTVQTVACYMLLVIWMALPSILASFYEKMK